jgi:hypothetical protein
VSASKDLSIGLAEQAQLIQWHVGVWHDLGYPEPLPSPDCHPIPPLGERPVAAIKGGCDAVKDIDEMIRQLYALREQLVSELRQDDDLRAARVLRDAIENGTAVILTEDEPAAAAGCGCPEANGMIRHQRPTRTDPVAARLDRCADDAGSEQ